ncbi:MAG: hypothetical protein R3362_09965 [Rhodothermales bacterium]|nr:hypothetical protein [Rhodothermales bacterium]
MDCPDTNHDVLKQALKEAVAEVLHEQREWLQDVIAPGLEGMALAEALREVEAAERVGKPRGFGLLEGEA